jgi:hypothetical protein
MGTKPERNDLTPRGPDDELDRKIHAAMRLKGWIIPQTVEDVLRAEAELDDEGCDDLPEELMDPYAILRRETPRPLKVRPLHSAGDREAEKHLARAARAGGEIPPEIEGRMRHDRAAAEAVGADLSLSTFFQRLQQAGLDRDFVSRRLLPPSISAALSDERAGEGRDEETLTLRAADCISRVYGWSPAAVLGSKSPLQLDTAAVGGARFKLGARTDERRLGAYAVYAHFLALLILEATENPRRGPAPTDPNEVITTVHRTYGELTFENALRYVWDLGIPVLPLNDPGAFHGACWRIEGRNVIVLKQQTKSAARWLFDLLHELWHVAQEPGVQNLAVIEASETADERRNSAEEREASRFSGDVVLDGRAEELAQLCVNAAGGSVERLKAAVPRVAARHGVLTDSLANYMAFRLSLQGLNWWGAATNLQRTEVDPLQTARAALLDRVHLGRLNELDRELLRLALTDRPA